MGQFVLVQFSSWCLPSSWGVRVPAGDEEAQHSHLQHHQLKLRSEVGGLVQVMFVFPSCAQRWWTVFPFEGHRAAPVCGHDGSDWRKHVYRVPTPVIPISTCPEGPCWVAAGL